jgi:FKBP-type peptidyl-prolyl cis-trans isomerase FkpA
VRKKIAVILSLCLVLSGPLACSKAPEEMNDKEVELNTFPDKISYVLGSDIGASLRETKAEINVEALVLGIEDGLNERDLKIELEQANALKQEFSQKLQEEYAARMEGAAKNNLAEGEAFLTENKGKEGVVTTDSGLQYIVLTEGDGPLPAATDKVKVHYQGTLISGKVFDSSYERQEPVNFMLNSVIPGWVEALQLMKVGSKYKLFIPSALAYGEWVVGPDLGHNSTLIFEVVLLGIE